MKKILGKVISGALSAVMTLSLCTGLTLGTECVKAADSQISGMAARAEVSFDGTWNGNYDNNYNQQKEEKNSVTFRPQQEGSVTLAKRMYIEADVAIPEDLIAKITKDSTYFNLNAWLDYATNTKTDSEWYNENNNISGTDNFSSFTTVYSNTKYNVYENVDGAEKNTDYDLTKSGKYYIAHIKNAIEASQDNVNLNATELAYNFRITGVNISGDSYVVFDNVKLTDESGKQLAGSAFDEGNSDIIGLSSYSADSDMFTSYVNFNSTVTSYNNALSAALNMDAKYVSNEKESESWRNTKANEESIDVKKIYTSGLKMEAGMYNASATVFIPKETLDKATITNSMTFNINVDCATKLTTYDDGWVDMDWDSVVWANILGETKVIKDASGKLKYCYNTWAQDGENGSTTDYKDIPVFGNYYVLQVENPAYYDATNTFKGVNLSLYMSGDGCDYSGIIIADDYKLCSSSLEVININFDNEKGYSVSSGKADVTKPQYNQQGLVEYYDFVDNACTYFSVENTYVTTLINKSAASIYTGKSVEFRSVLKGGSDNTYFAIGNSKIATLKVTNEGVAVVTGVKKGTTYLYATANGVTTKSKITVKSPTLTLKKTSATIKKGKKVTIKATAAPTATITYTSKNKKIATVTSKGVVKGIKKGTTYIIVKGNGITKKFKVTVK